MIGKEIDVENHGKDSIWESIKNALKFTYQSAQGKYDLNSYLEVLGDYTDQEIREFTASGYSYGGGEVVFSTKPGDVSIKTVVKMYFLENETNKHKMKKAERFLEKSMFVDETIKDMESKEEIAFEINAPEED